MKIDKISWIFSLFLKYRVIIAALSDKGTKPEGSDKWTMSVIKEDRDDNQALTKCVGRGSSCQVVDLEVWMMQVTSSVVGID